MGKQVKSAYYKSLLKIHDARQQIKCSEGGNPSCVFSPPPPPHTVQKAGAFLIQFSNAPDIAQSWEEHDRQNG